jgi:hypothetical protein
MDNKSKLYKAIISIIAITVSILAAGIGYGFMGASNAVFPIRFLCGWIFILTPISVIWLVLELFRKDK